VHLPRTLTSARPDRLSVFPAVGRGVVPIILLLVVGQVVLATMAVSDLMRASNKTGRLMQAKYEVIADTEELYVAVSDAETEQRTFLLTRERAAFDEFQSSKARVANAIGRLDAELEGSPNAPALQAISKASHDRIVNLEAEMGQPAARSGASARFEPGRATMRQLRAAIADLVNGEEKLLGQRRAALERDRFDAAIKALGATLGLLLAGGLGANAFIRTKERLSQQEREARAAGDSALAALAASEERLRLAQDATGIGSFDWNLVTGEIIGNDSFYRITGTDRRARRFSDSVSSIVHPTDRDRIGAALHGSLETGAVTDLELRLAADADGTVRWVRSLGKTILDVNARPIRRIGIIIDITERKQAEEDLRASEERLRLALASGNLGTWSFDSKTGILHFDQLAQSIFGVGSDHLDRLADFKALLHPDDRAIFARENVQLRTGSDVLNVEYRLPRDDGSVRWVHLSGTVDRAANPDRSQLIGVVADITDKREAAERMRILRNEFAHLARVNDLGEMAAAIAHEINQPLTAISNYLNAGQLPACKEPEEMMRCAAEQALRAGQIVRRLRAFIGKGTGEREACGADGLIDGAAALAAVDAGVNGVTVVRTAEAGDAIVNVDPVQVQQVVVNLIRNAIDALSINAPGAERKLTIATRIGNEGHTVEFKIADTGPGISPDIAPRLFEPFTTSKANGMGMGLSVCRRLIEAHGGSIWIEHPPSGGATFRFDLPIETAST
jgi:two-component system sensor kinase FixL